MGAGSDIAYTLTVANAGPSVATGVSVVDTLPRGSTLVSASGVDWTCTSSGNVSVTCTRATLDVGATVPAITVRVTAPADPTTMKNTATVDAATADPDTSNNNSAATAEVTAVADLSLAKAGPAQVSAGDQIRYTLTVVNHGPSDAAHVSVTDTLPTGVTFVSATGSGWTCADAGNGSVTCGRPRLASGRSTTITLVVTAPSVATSVRNQAAVYTRTYDPNDENNAGAAGTEVLATSTGGGGELPGTGGHGLGLLWAGLLLVLVGAALRFGRPRRR